MKDKREKAAPLYEVVCEPPFYAIHRNGRYLMTPAGSAFRAPTEKLAQSIANEWQAQGEKIIPSQMPMTQLMATALDLVSKGREKTITGLLAYIASEHLCHRAEEPEALVAKQEQLWQPFLSWCTQRFDVGFVTGCGVMPIAQSPETTERLRVVLESYDDFKLTGLSSATDTSGSLILGLALAEEFAPADAVFQASELDTDHQAIKWGEDPVTLARQKAIRDDLDACEKWFGLLKE